MAVCAEIALAQQIFLLQSPDVPGDKAALKAALQAELFAHGALLDADSFASWPIALTAPAFAAQTERRFTRSAASASAGPWMA